MKNSEEQQPQTDKTSYDAMAFYEKHCDYIGLVDKDDEYPDFDFHLVSNLCLVNQKHETTSYGGRCVKTYSRHKFKKIVADYFKVKVDEMESHWREFK